MTRESGSWVSPSVVGGSGRARVEPAGVEFDVEIGETVFDAACRQGYNWPSICMGQGTCTHCHVRILAGEENAGTASSALEKRGIARLEQRLYKDAPEGIRLACQLEISGDVIMEQRSFNGKRT